jgi:hypothetical protein
MACPNSKNGPKNGLCSLGVKPKKIYGPRELLLYRDNQLRMCDNISLTPKGPRVLLRSQI